MSFGLVVEVTSTVGVGADVVRDTPMGAGTWPAWAVPVKALGEWLLLQVAIAEAPPVCRVEPELWWSTRSTPGEAVAVEACSWCPVLVQCRAYALAAREREGVWGGLTPAERKAAAS